MGEICTACKKLPRVEGYKRCKKCLVYFRQYRKVKNKTQCTTCGGPRDSNKKTCKKCLASKQKTYDVVLKHKRGAVKKERKTAGLCIQCGESKKTSRTLFCTECLDKQKSDRKKRRQQWRQEGRCTNCGNIRDELPLLRCAKCNSYRKRTILRNKIEVITNYGTSCECCGSNQLEFLSIDHINGGGTKHRKKISNLYQWLKRNDYPDGFRVLCLKCNNGRSRNSPPNKPGLCPHKEQSVMMGPCRVTQYTKSVLLNGRSNRKSTLKLNLEVIDNYGGKCRCCKENQYEFLSLDHIKGGGRKHVNSIKGTIYSWAKRNNYPKDVLQVYCTNCNMGKYINQGICPHKSDKKVFGQFLLSKKTFEQLTWAP